MSQPLAQPLPQTAGQCGEQLRRSPKLTQSLADPSELPWGTHQPRLTTRPKANPCINWSSYMDDIVEGDEAEAAGMPGADTSVCTGPFGMLDEPFHMAGSGRSMQSMHKPMQSPMDATLQPLIPSPIGGHANLSMTQQQQQQQTCDHKVPAHHQRFQAMQQHWPEQGSTQKTMLPIRQPAGLASSLSSHTTGTEPSDSNAMNSKLNVTAPSKHVDQTVSEHNGGEGVYSMSQTADKENVQQLGCKAPVRKALFGGPLLHEAEGPAAAWHSQPAAQFVPDTMGNLDAKRRDGGIASTEDQQPAQPVVQSKEPDTVDFSSVFDFL